MLLETETTITDMYKSEVLKPVTNLYVPPKTSAFPYVPKPTPNPYTVGKPTSNKFMIKPNTV